MAYRSAIGDQSPPVDMIDRTKHVPDLVNAEALRAALDHAQAIRNLIARGDALRVLEIEYPKITELEFRRRAADADLQRILRMFDKGK